MNPYEAAASAAIACQPKKYGVFISFRGSDIRTGFLSHIYRALSDEGIRTFMDEKLERGKTVSKALLGNIERSAIALVILSKDYASSPWCLDELVKIMQCKAVMNQSVVPVFYEVDPSDVENLTGSFGAAMTKHREEFRDSLHRVAAWNDALKEIAGISGLVSQRIKSESKLLEQIVYAIMKKLDKRAAACQIMCGYPPILPPPSMGIPSNYGFPMQPVMAPPNLPFPGLPARAPFMGDTLCPPMMSGMLPPPMMGGMLPPPMMGMSPPPMMGRMFPSM